MVLLLTYMWSWHASGIYVYIMYIVLVSFMTICGRCDVSTLSLEMTLFCDHVMMRIQHGFQKMLL